MERLFSEEKGKRLNEKKIETREEQNHQKPKTRNSAQVPNSCELNPCAFPRLFTRMKTEGGATATLRTTRTAEFHALPWYHRHPVAAGAMNHPQNQCTEPIQCTERTDKGKGREEAGELSSSRSATSTSNARQHRTDTAASTAGTAAHLPLSNPVQNNGRAVHTKRDCGSIMVLPRRGRGRSTMPVSAVPCPRGVWRGHEERVSGESREGTRSSRTNWWWPCARGDDGREAVLCWAAGNGRKRPRRGFEVFSASRLPFRGGSCLRVRPFVLKRLPFRPVKATAHGPWGRALRHLGQLLVFSVSSAVRHSC